ncbi:cation:proton antiporter [Synechococcus sp. CBW1004]|jgi:Kef-type K+ transport system membrane component KefB|uniref:cation:proton antiporter n=1 Tax=Synechococcus sp. CBW1004 TaxID=1353136 RepID=UPI0018CDCAB9|nr:cation:proton antiporter [Synechococcus sp. CBW1004]QPN63419.1 cation:proton antiporter [Synechococcus sp. CBW1004]
MHASPLLGTLLLLLTGVALARLSAGRLARWAVPAILVELLVGFLLGNSVLPFERVAPLGGITELGVLSLFFQVGLEVRGDLLIAQRRTLLRLVAISALAPLLFFWPLRTLFGLSVPTTLLCLAVLCATGTGVTLRVLAQRQALTSPSGRLLVGVSVLDDLPAILLLALSTALGAGEAAGHGGGAGWLGPPLGLLLGLASLLAVDTWRRHRPERPSSPLSILLLLIASAWLGELVGLTSLFGAFWGGLLLARLSPLEQDVRAVLVLLCEVFLPLYFISVGMRIEAASLLAPGAWGMAAVLVVMALVSKLACGLGITAHDTATGVDRRLVIYGLIPRGLPGLVFATTALKAGVVNASQFSALVLMVSFTTVVGLLLLERRLQRLTSLPGSHTVDRSAVS